MLNSANATGVWVGFAARRENKKKMRRVRKAKNLASDSHYPQMGGASSSRDDADICQVLECSFRILQVQFVSCPTPVPVPVYPYQPDNSPG